MERLKTHAFVFYSEPFWDYDKRVILLTQDFGKVTAIAPAAQRSLKRFGSALESLTQISIVYTEKRTSSLVRLEEAAIIYSFPSLKKDIKKMAYGSYFLEVISEVMREKEVSKSLFDFLFSFLKALEKSKHEELLCRLFEARLLSRIGYKPVLHHCLKCKVPLKDLGAISFSFLEGGVVCTGTCHLEARRGSPRIRKEFFREISKESISYLEKMIHKEKSLPINLRLSREIKTFLPAFLFFQLGREMKSYQFIEQVVQ